MTAAWRRALLLNRAALLRAWPHAFSRHDFVTLRLVQPVNVPPRGWDESWSAAAREYHAERRLNPSRR